MRDVFCYLIYNSFINDVGEIKDILIISTLVNTPRFEHLLGDDSQFEIKLSYKVQPSPDELA